jgi:GNAT superfamily N-acetyltransferase
MIRYTVDEALVDALRADDLAPFFDGWPTPPSLERRLAALAGAAHVALAFDGDRLIGFATTLSDGALMSSISLLEVLPPWRRRGVGAELVRLVVDADGDRYGVDVVCDDDVAGFYARLGFRPVRGMVLRRRGSLP